MGMTYSESPTDVATAAPFLASTPISLEFDGLGAVFVIDVMDGGTGELHASLTFYGSTVSYFTRNGSGRMTDHSAEFAPSAMLAAF